MIGLKEVGLVLAGDVPVCQLRLDRTHAAFSLRGLFLHRRTRHDAALPAVIADAVHRDVIDDGFVDIHVTNDCGVHMADSGVVVEVVSTPVAAFIAAAIVAVAVVHAAIETDVRTPVSRMPDVAAVTPAPPAGSPEQAVRRSHDPGTGHPVVVIAVPCPVTGRPDVIRPRANRLIINGERRRRRADGNSDADLGECSRESYQQRCEDEEL